MAPQRCVLLSVLLFVLCLSLGRAQNPSGQTQSSTTTLEVLTTSVSRIASQSTAAASQTTVRASTTTAAATTATSYASFTTSVSRITATEAGLTITTGSSGSTSQTLSPLTTATTTTGSTIATAETTTAELTRASLTTAVVTTSESTSPEPSETPHVPPPAQASAWTVVIAVGICLVVLLAVGFLARTMNQRDSSYLPCKAIQPEGIGPVRGVPRRLSHSAALAMHAPELRRARLARLGSVDFAAKLRALKSPSPLRCITSVSDADTSLLSLPTEVLLLILDLFDVLELLRLRAVSKDLQWLVDRSVALQTHHSFVLCRFRHAGFLHFLSKATSLRRLVLLYAEPAYDWGWAECLSIQLVQETLCSLEAYPWPPQCGMFLVAPLFNLQTLRLESTEEQDLAEDRFYLSHLSSLRRLSLRWFTGVAGLLREMPLALLSHLELKLPEAVSESEAAEVEAILDELAEKTKGRGKYTLVIDAADGRVETHWGEPVRGSRLAFSKQSYFLQSNWRPTEPMQVQYGE